MFWRITLPLLTPVIFFNFIMQMVQAFQEFNGPYVITGGGPLKSTYLLPLMIYDEAFKYFDVGYARALSWVLFVHHRGADRDRVPSSKYWVFYAQRARGQAVSAVARPRPRWRRHLNPALRYAVLVGVGFLMLYPLLWMIGGAFKPNSRDLRLDRLHPAGADPGRVPRRAGRPAPSTPSRPTC